MTSAARAAASPIHTLPVPAWLWGVAFGVVIAVAGADLIVSTRRGREPGLAEAALCTAGIVALGALFGAAVAATAGPRASGQFFAGWLTEYSLSLDNLFVFVLLIGRSAVPPRQRSRVLLLGIGLALVLRAAFIAAGTAALSRFDWVLYLFGAMLLITAGRLAYGTASGSGTGLAAVSLPGPAGPVRRLLPGTGGAGSRLRRALPPVLALAGAIAATDLVFAMDSIPAVFGLTRDPLMVLAVNAFALLGLRHLYYLIGGLLDRLAHLSAGLSAILAFIGVKLLIEALAQSGVTRAGPLPLPHISTALSLCVIGGVLATVTVTSLLAARRRPGQHRLSQPGATRSARPPRRPARPSGSHQ
ncbi:MAG TPA: TerC/Alx family metal homeostasis membrane protein [Streptosporangiaceae bacterium]|nr:TerC/Alx family metal homeostasis membrane protein [Streptosporangiaceae bacterium]